jgi:glycosyltransferase involved in cell wall biosynthesis
MLTQAEAGPDCERGVAAAREYCQNVVVAPLDNSAPITRLRRISQLRSLASSQSFERRAHHRRATQAALDELLARDSFDLVTVVGVYMAGYRLPRTTRVVLDAHNIEYDVRLRTARSGVRLDRRLYNYLNALKLRQEERRAWRRVDGCVVASARDRALLQRDAPQARCTVVANGVDTHVFRPGKRAPVPGRILFFGALDYYPNSDGLRFFLREVMPRLRAHRLPVELVVVGRPGPDKLDDPGARDVFFTGAVDDLCPYLESASVIVAPIRIGGGTRLKILEALAMAKPVVATSLGAEAISVRHERDILLADTAGAFADQVRRALADPGLGARLGAAGRELVERQYTWRASIETLEQFYVELLSGVGVNADWGIRSRRTTRIAHL